MQHVIHRGPTNTLIRAHFLFEPQDLWVGLYWKRYPKALDLYFCLLPMLPLNVYVQWGM